jgi:protein arginine kinase
MLRYKMAWARPDGPENAVVLSSRVRLARNVEGKPFPARSSENDLAGVLKSAFDAAAETRLKDAARVELSDVTPLERHFLVERKLISRGHAESPAGRGVLVGDRDAMSVMVNEEDHLRLQNIDSGLCLARLWDEASALDDDFAERLPFSYRPKWGYLTCCPTNAGTGMRASCLVHLPGLTVTGRIESVLRGLERLGVLVRGLYGEGTRVLGDFYQVSNRTALGDPEEKIVDGVTAVVRGLIAKEREAREELAAGDRKLKLEDLVYRSLGLLSNARLLTYEETMHHLSYVRMGLALDWKLPTDLAEVNELLVLAQPAHIQMLAGKTLDRKDREFLRSTLVRRKLGS